MADLDKCDAKIVVGGEEALCPFKYSCRRFTAPCAPDFQAFLVKAPYNPVTHSCASFLSNAPTKLPTKETRA